MSAGKAILVACAAAVATGAFVRVRRLKRAVKDAEGRLAGYGAETAVLSYGRITYVDRGPNCKASDGMCFRNEEPSGNRLDVKAPGGKGLDDKTSGGKRLLDGEALDGKGRSPAGGGRRSFPSTASMEATTRRLRTSEACHRDIAFLRPPDSDTPAAPSREKARRGNRRRRTPSCSTAWGSSKFSFSEFRRAGLPRSASLWTSPSAPRA